MEDRLFQGFLIRGLPSHHLPLLPVFLAIPTSLATTAVLALPAALRPLTNHLWMLRLARLSSATQLAAYKRWNEFDQFLATLTLPLPLDSGYQEPNEKTPFSDLWLRALFVSASRYIAYGFAFTLVPLGAAGVIAGSTLLSLLLALPRDARNYRRAGKWSLVETETSAPGTSARASP